MENNVCINTNKLMIKIFEEKGDFMVIGQNDRIESLESRIRDLEVKLAILEKKLENDRRKQRKSTLEDAVNIIEENITTTEEVMAWTLILKELGFKKHL